MTAVILKDEQRAARKHYKCDAYLWWNSCGGDIRELTPDQLLIVQAAEADRGRILPGQRYVYRRGVHEGSMFTWRARIGMDNVCRDLGLYEDD